MRRQYNVDELLTFDDLVSRAQQALVALRALAFNIL